MSAKRLNSLEMRNAVIWLERQPEVTSVVQGRYTTVRHKHKPGFTRVLSSDKKSVHLRTFDKQGSKDLFVYAPPSALRDRWVAALASGDVFNASGNGPSLAATVKVMPMGQVHAHVAVPTPKPTNPEAGQLFDVTPALATQWLERNTRNRSLRESVVQRYASDMKSGRWMVTGDAIAFDINGAIVNGQHRLWAVIFADMTVSMLVTFNLQPDVVRVLDDHLKRKLTDIVKISKPGSNISAKMTAVSRVMQTASIMLLSSDQRNAIARLSRQQQMLFLEEHEEAISYVVRECFKSSNVRGLSAAPVVGVVARAYYTQDHDRLKQFAQVLMSGIPENTKDDMGALLLRNWLLSNASMAKRTASEVIYRKTQRALWAFCKREPLKRVLYEAQNELFFLPKDKAPKTLKAKA